MSNIELAQARPGSMRIIRQARVAKRRFARGINKTAQGAASKFTGQKPKIGTEGYLSYNPLHNKNVAKGYGFENSLVGGALAKKGNRAAKAGRFYQRRAMKLPFAQKNPRRFRNTIAGGVSRFNPMFSAKEYGDVIEFASQAPGIDPALVQNLIMDASRIQQEGQTKVVISQQLFQQIEAALQNYHIQKQQIDGQSAERMQQGFEAGRQGVLEFGKKLLPRLKRKLRVNALKNVGQTEQRLRYLKRLGFEAGSQGTLEFSAPSMIRGKRGGLLTPTGKKMKAWKRRARAKRKLLPFQQSGFDPRDLSRKRVGRKLRANALKNVRQTEKKVAQARRPAQSSSTREPGTYHISSFEAGRRGILEFNRFKTARTSVKGIPFKQKPRKIPKKIRDLAVDPDAEFLKKHAKGMGKPDSTTDRFLKRREEMLRQDATGNIPGYDSSIGARRIIERRKALGL